MEAQMTIQGRRKRVVAHTLKMKSRGRGQGQEAHYREQVVIGWGMQMENRVQSRGCRGWCSKLTTEGWQAGIAQRSMEGKREGPGACTQRM